MCEGEVQGTIYGLSDSGWITSELFDLRFVHHFLSHAPAAHPLLLLLDGHSLHYNPSVISKAAEEKVIIFCLPHHSSHETHPLDKGPFSPLNLLGKRCVRSFWLTILGSLLQGSCFPIVWWSMDAFNDFKNVQAGFYPLKRDMIVPLVKEATTSTLAQYTGLHEVHTTV